MPRFHDRSPKRPVALTRHRNTATKARFRRATVTAGKHGPTQSKEQPEPYAPPEDWYAPTGNRRSYEVIVQPPGPGYRHVVTERQIRERLSLLPARFLRPLEVVQLSRMTRKKQTFPCYGMQWGQTLYLYPIETTLTETFHRPPQPNVINEVNMFGGRWVHTPPGQWKIVWNETSIRDFYLNNILIHELGHLLDERNSRYAARERYAEWFAIEYGYRPSRPRARKRKKKVTRRHCGV